MKKYFVNKDGKFLNTVLEFDAKAYPAEKKAEEWLKEIGVRTDESSTN